MANRRPFRSALPALVLAALLGLTACGGGTGAGAEGTHATSAPSSPNTPQPAPASSTAPARNIAVPEMPATARENSKEGLESFAEYYISLVNYGYNTGDTTPLENVSDPDCSTCKTWKNSIRGIYSTGWAIGSTVSVVKASTKFEAFKDGSRSLDLIAHQTEFQSVKGTQTESHKGGDTPLMELLAKHENGRWTVLDLGTPS